MTQNFNTTSVFGIILISAILISFQGLSNTVFAESKVPESDSIGDIHIRAHFKMSNMEFDNNSFKIFHQVSGYHGPDELSQEKAVFTTAGAPGYENMWLYHVADAQHRGYQTDIDPDEEFSVRIEMHQGDVVFRSFDYSKCVVSDYKVTTLHDGDETFAGLTKFVYADTFEFTCSGLVLDCPFHYVDPVKADTESSIDRNTNERSTWPSNFTYESN
jgi:hypothetical protein